jgi:hypothetical protein
MQGDVTIDVSGGKVRIDLARPIEVGNRAKGGIEETESDRPIGDNAENVTLRS